MQPMSGVSSGGNNRRKDGSFENDQVEKMAALIGHGHAV